MTMELDEAAVRARLEAATPGPWMFEPEGESSCSEPACCSDYWDNRIWGYGIVLAESHMLSTDDAEFIAHARTDVERLLAALDEARAERDKAQRAAKTLGGIVEQNARMILDITGLHDWIDEDGDGDWGAVWESAYELLPRRRAAESALAAVRALADRAREWVGHADTSPHLEVFGTAWMHTTLIRELSALATPTTPENGDPA